MNSSKITLFFSVCYYFSSLLPQYLLLLIIYFFSDDKFIKVVLIFLVILSTFFLCLLNKKLKQTMEYSNAQGMRTVMVGTEKNSGIVEFFLSITLPVVTSFSNDAHPMLSIIIVLFIQFCLFLFYMSSTDSFFNISMIILGYNLYTVEDSNKKCGIKYVITRNNNIYNKKIKVVCISKNDPDFKYSLYKNK